jgi:aerobic-type carbon monoxide dehydrogenase small subunit (CoxS/CutS family)
MIMSVKGLLDRTLEPSPEAVREAIAGNLCRCGTYPNTVKAALAAARVLRDPQAKWESRAGAARCGDA